MKRAWAILTVAVLVSLVVVPGAAAAQETRTGGTVVIEENETVEGLTVIGGTVVVDGTVDGDLTVVGGSATVDGDVTGDIESVTGDLRIDGTVGGDVDAAGGNVRLGPEGRVNGSLSAAAGGVSINGVVTEDAEIAAGSIFLGENARIGGDLTYAGELEQSGGAQVGGQIVQDASVVAGPVQYPMAFEWVLAVYALLINLLLGIILLALAPGFARDVADRATGSILGSVGIGLLVLLGVPILLALLAITVVGIPLTLAGTLLFVLYVWFATVYGRFAVGAWLIGLVGARNRWVALLVGLILVGLLAQIPFVGPAISGIVTLIGVGAVALALRDARRERGELRRSRDEQP